MTDLVLFDKDYSVPEAHHLNNPTLNTEGVQCGVAKTLPMRVEDTPPHIDQQGSVPPTRRISVLMCKSIYELTHSRNNCFL